MTDTTKVTTPEHDHAAVYWGLVLGVAPVMAFAGVLYRYTHHRPLGAVTFTLLSGVVMWVGVLVARRCKAHGGAAWHVCRIAALLSLLLPIGAVALAGP